MEQEMALLAQKMDVAEEMNRLDFMMQEFNRESNTLASKSISKDVTAAAVELKVLIEQMREQIQNVE